MSIRKKIEDAGNNSKSMPGIGDPMDSTISQAGTPGISGNNENIEAATDDIVKPENAENFEGMSVDRYPSNKNTQAMSTPEIGCLLKMAAPVGTVRKQGMDNGNTGISPLNKKSSMRSVQISRKQTCSFGALLGNSASGRKLNPRSGRIYEQEADFNSTQLSIASGTEGHSSSTMSSNKKISLTLLVDKQHSRVVFAESDKDLVDVLLSFLTMPMGTICRLLKKDPSMGCIANLYESIENLDGRHFQTEACKPMLLHPLNVADQYCENLMVNVDNTKPGKRFVCGEPGCQSKARLDGIFVKGGVQFVITDDLHIMPASTAVLLSLQGKLGKNDRVLEERVLDLGHEEILNLLQKTLASKSPLTNLFLNSSTTCDPSHMDGMFEPIPKSECDADSECNEVKVKLLVTKNGNKVVHMEGDKEMADLLFSFIVSPLGSLIKLLNKNSGMGCVGNIYRSVERLCLEGNDFIKLEKCKMMLRHCKLAPSFGFQNQFAMIVEMASVEHSVQGCYPCYRSSGNAPAFRCVHGAAADPGGGCAKGPGRFILTDDLHLSPFSLISTVRAVYKLEMPFTDLVEKEISIKEVQALNLLKAALVSQTALTSVFAPKNYQRRRVKTV